MIGIESIQIKMHDDIVRTLTDVKHVPGLRKNLIFWGSTITGGATIALSSDIDFETTKLWHMRLGHMSEKGMDMLSKQGLLGSKRNMNAGFCEHCVFGKQYRMKFSWVIYTNKDLTFDESSMLSKKVESTDAGKDHRVKKKVELKDLELEQLDVKTVFLHDKLEEQIFMHQPKGFMIQDKEDHVFLLKRSLYGLKQSPRQWYKLFDTFIVERRYTKSAYDSYVCYQRLADGSRIHLLLYVDDMLIAVKMMLDINDLKEYLKREFEIKNLGAAKRMLGMEIQRDGHDVVSQGTVMVEKIPTVKNSANMMTKHNPEIKFKHCLDLIDISNIEVQP
ncbi:hypothetical protein RJ639_019013 [Escallonia herrerae]|uniref:Gag-pol polyprotein n=1 Tax=Escallonia herrerae TaxID=1293975 RepID=A0AA88V6H3_9ASTE|nr:hypothetical protein RJ639_019013 [Escallonia herrerae]